MIYSIWCRCWVFIGIVAVIVVFALIGNGVYRFFVTDPLAHQNRVGILEIGGMLIVLVGLAIASLIIWKPK